MNSCTPSSSKPTPTRFILFESRIGLIAETSRAANLQSKNTMWMWWCIKLYFIMKIDWCMISIGTFLQKNKRRLKILTWSSKPSEKYNNTCVIFPKFTKCGIWSTRSPFDDIWGNFWSHRHIIFFLDFYFVNRTAHIISVQYSGWLNK